MNTQHITYNRHVPLKIGRINDNLEQQAQALFKSWFVDFEPFKEGKFIDSELGLIPQGWRVGTLSELINIRYGKDHKKLTNGSIPVYGSGGVMRHVSKALYSGESVLIPRKGTLNNVMYVNGDFWCVDTMFFSEMKFSNVLKYVFLFVSSKDLAAMNAGSAVPSMTTEILNKIQTIIPSCNCLKDFESIVASIFAKQEKNESENQNLERLRDTLLPKLMSGELKTNDLNS